MPVAMQHGSGWKIDRRQAGTDSATLIRPALSCHTHPSKQRHRSGWHAPTPQPASRGNFDRASMLASKTTRSAPLPEFRAGNHLLAESTLDVFNSLLKMRMAVGKVIPCIGNADGGTPRIVVRGTAHLLEPGTVAEGAETLGVPPPVAAKCIWCLRRPRPLNALPPSRIVRLRTFLNPFFVQFYTASRIVSGRTKFASRHGCLGDERPRSKLSDIPHVRDVV
jgi:hypothetical protein